VPTLILLAGCLPADTQAPGDVRPPDPQADRVVDQQRSSASSSSRCSRARLIRSSTFAGDNRAIRSTGPGGAGTLARSSRWGLSPFASRRDLLTASSMQPSGDNPACPAPADPTVR
jgi:hypothetical protein